MKHTSIALLTLSAAVLALASCKNSDDSSSAETDTVGADGVRTIHITGNDQLQYNINEITATAGEMLRIEMTNIGKMPKQAMAHNWLLLEKMSEEEANAFGMAAASKPPEYLPDDMSAVLFHTEMLGPGETDTIEIVVPEEAGEYIYLCTFPGHFVTMRGKLIVTSAGEKEA